MTQTENAATGRSEPRQENNTQKNDNAARQKNQGFFNDTSIKIATIR